MISEDAARLSVPLIFLATEFSYNKNKAEMFGPD